MFLRFFEKEQIIIACHQHRITQGYAEFHLINAEEIVY
jgi:hypothetical protein